MTVMERCEKCGLVPVVVIENVKDAVPAAKAMLAGGIDAMEITMRTEAGLESIRRVCEEVPEMLVGAGTVLTLEKCAACVEAGAKFIVSPGFDEEIVKYCVENNVAVLPGCVTPTEIMAAMKLGITTVKFFPANVYGGLKAMKALSGPFGMIRFLPTGGVNAETLGEYIAAPFIAAVGGSWTVSAKDITANNFERIEQLCREAREIIDRARQK